MNALHRGEGEPALSVVAPCYNEQDGLSEFHRRMSEACRRTVGNRWEIILVNDGSRDATWSVMRRLFAEDPNVVAINLSRNYGHQLALTAGLQYCRGDKVLVIDADLQDPPELLGDMVRVMEAEKADVVYGQRRERTGESFGKKTTAALFYRLLRRLIEFDIPVDTGDFRLMTRRALEALNAMPEHHRFIRGMVSWIGFRQVAFPYNREPRFAGATGYPFSKMVRFALDAITSFSVAPLRLASALGVAFGVIGIAMLTYTLGSWALGLAVTGWTSLATIELILGSVQLIVLGVIGEYLGRLYLESKRRPLFILESVLRHEADAVVVPMEVTG